MINNTLYKTTKKIDFLCRVCTKTDLIFEKTLVFLSLNKKDNSFIISGLFGDK